MDQSPNSNANSLSQLYRESSAGSTEALERLKTEAQAGRAAALYLWAHLSPESLFKWCANQPVPPHHHVVQVMACLMHWGSAGERNDPGALTYLWLAGDKHPSLADELSRERLFELIPELRPFPKESDLQIRPGLHHHINRRVWQIRAAWRGEPEE